MVFNHATVKTVVTELIQEQNVLQMHSFSVWPRCLACELCLRFEFISSFLREGTLEVSSHIAAASARGPKTQISQLQVIRTNSSKHEYILILYAVMTWNAWNRIHQTCYNVQYSMSFLGQVIRGIKTKRRQLRTDKTDWKCCKMSMLLRIYGCKKLAIFLKINNL